MFVIVPNYIADEINRRLDEELVKHPAAAADRGFLYSQILTYFNEHGVIPDFQIVSKSQHSTTGATL